MKIRNGFVSNSSSSSFVVSFDEKYSVCEKCGRAPLDAKYFIEEIGKDDYNELTMHKVNPKDKCDIEGQFGEKYAKDIIKYHNENPDDEMFHMDFSNHGSIGQLVKIFAKNGDLKIIVDDWE